MVRTQIQLTEQQYKLLRNRAARRGVSMAELVREGVDKVLSAEEGLGNAEEARRRALELMNKFSSGKRDVARKHDEYLGEVY